MMKRITITNIKAMPRTNQITKRLFAERHGDYEDFLNLDATYGLRESATLKLMKRKYKRVIDVVKDPLEDLVNYEEIIIQIRCKEVVNSELRLSLSRNYIYARS